MQNASAVLASWSAVSATAPRRLFASNGPYDPRLDQLSHQRSRQLLVRLEADGTLADVVPRELVLHVLHHGAGVEGAVVLGGGEPDEHLPVEAEGGDLVADALLRLRRR